jgi:hypothetical protein
MVYLWCSGLFLNEYVSLFICASVSSELQTAYVTLYYIKTKITWTVVSIVCIV